MSVFGAHNMLCSAAKEASCSAHSVCPGLGCRCRQWGCIFDAVVAVEMAVQLKGFGSTLHAKPANNSTHSFCVAGTTTTACGCFSTLHNQHVPYGVVAGRWLRGACRMFYRPCIRCFSEGEGRAKCSNGSWFCATCIRMYGKAHSITDQVGLWALTHRVSVDPTYKRSSRSPWP